MKYDTKPVVCAYTIALENQPKCCGQRMTGPEMRTLKFRCDTCGREDFSKTPECDGCGRPATKTSPASNYTLCDICWSHECEYGWPPRYSNLPPGYKAKNQRKTMCTPAQNAPKNDAETGGLT